MAQEAAARMLTNQHLVAPLVRGAVESQRSFLLSQQGSTVTGSANTLNSRSFQASSFPARDDNVHNMSLEPTEQVEERRTCSCLPLWFKVKSFTHFMHWLALGIGGGTFVLAVVTVISIITGSLEADWRMDAWNTLWEVIELPAFSISNPILIFMYLLKNYSVDPCSASGRLKEESEKLQRMYEAYNSRLENLLLDLRQGELEEVRNNFEGAKEQFKRFLGPWTRVLSRKDNSTPASLIDQWPETPQKEALRNGFGTVCKVWAAALAEAQPGFRGDKTLGIDDATGVADMMDRAKKWETKLQFNLTAMQEGYNNEQETQWRTQRLQNQNENFRTGPQFPRVKLCCFQTAIPDHRELQFCRIHILYHLVLQIFIGLFLAFARIGQLLLALSDEHKDRDAAHAHAMQAGLMAAVWFAYVVSVSFVCNRMGRVALVQSVKEVEAQQEKFLQIRERLHALDENATWTAALARWRGSTLPRLDIIDWAQRKFRETPAVVAVFAAHGREILADQDRHSELSDIVGRFSAVLDTLSPEALCDVEQLPHDPSFHDLNENGITLKSLACSDDFAQLRSILRKHSVASFDSGNDVFGPNGSAEKLLKNYTNRQIPIQDLHQLIET